MHVVYQSFGSHKPGPVWNGVGCLKNFGRLAFGDRPMPGNDKTLKWMRPGPLERCRHLARCLACSGDDRPAFRRIRQMANQCLVGVRGLDRLMKQGLQKRSWIGNQPLLPFSDFADRPVVYRTVALALGRVSLRS